MARILIGIFLFVLIGTGAAFFFIASPEYAEGKKALVLGEEAYNKQQFEDASRWFHEAAKEGEARAQFLLARMYSQGHGVERNARQAAHWYHMAASHGLARAQYQLGFFYENGRGLNRDEVEAAHWYRRAAEQGYAPALNALGYMYATGRGVAADRKKAAHWFSEAARQGLEMAGDNLNRLKRGGNGFGLLNMAIEHGARTRLLTRPGSGADPFDRYTKPLI